MLIKNTQSTVSISVNDHPDNMYAVKYVQFKVSSCLGIMLDRMHLP